MATSPAQLIELTTRRRLRHEPEASAEIFVVFTSPRLTTAALKKAGVLAGRLRAHALMLLARIVPYPLALVTPPAALSFDEGRIRSIAGCPVETRVLLCLCRDEWDMLTMALTSNSIVVIGRRKRWWPTREARLARRLRHAGHFVIFAEAE